jgi:hypothetical protein
MPINVPKIIWQTHNYTYYDLPEHLKKVTRTWINLNPTWEYKYINNLERKKFIELEDPALYSYYCRSNHITQSNIWRYLITYKYGGAYADMDSVCTRPLDYMLNNLQCKHDILSIGQAGVPPFDYNDSNYVVDKNSTNLKQIIHNIKYEESLKIKLQDLKSPLLWFCEQAQKNDTFCNDFNAAIHSSGYKTKFNDSFNVNYYGYIMPYSKLMNKLNLPMI